MPGLLVAGLLIAGWAGAEVPLDSGFGAGDGYVLVPFDDGQPGDDRVMDLIVDGAGRLLVAGTTVTDVGTNAANGALAVARLLPDGTLDPTFASGGRWTLQLELGGAFDEGTRIHATADGGYLVCGLAGTDPASGLGQVVLVKVRDDGSLDPGFDFDGVRLLSIAPPGGANQHVRCASAPGDKVVVAAAAYDATQNSPVVGVARLNADGSNDLDFNGTGQRFIDPSQGDLQIAAPLDVAVRADGRVLVAGVANNDPTGVDLDGFVLQLQADGSVDTGFADAGVRILTMDQGNGNVDVLVDVDVLADGGAALAGHSTTLLAGRQVLLARLLADGALDSTFGTGGRALFGLPGNGDDEATQLVVDDQGRMLVTTLSRIDASDVDLGLLRVTPDGTTDSAFGDAGWSTFAVGADGETAYDAGAAIALDAQGRAVMAGAAEGDADNRDMLVLRLAGEQVFDDGFEAMP